MCNSEIIDRFVPRILPGPLKCNNENALDWSFHGLIAYACSNTVIILHAESFLIIKTYNLHIGDVTSLKWFPVSTNFGKEYENLIVSTDDKGTIILSDLNKPNPVKEFSNIEKSIIVINWILQDDLPSFLILTKAGFLKILNMNTGSVMANHQVLGSDISFCIHTITSDVIIYNNQGLYKFNFKDRVHSKPSTSINAVYMDEPQSGQRGASYSILPFKSDDKSHIMLGGIHFLLTSNNLILIQLQTEVLLVDIESNTVLSVTNIKNNIRYLIPLHILGGFFICTEGNQMTVYKGEKFMYDSNSEHFNDKEVCRDTRNLSTMTLCASYCYKPIGFCDFRQLNIKSKAMGMVCNPLMNLSYCVLYESGEVLGLSLYNGNDDAWLPHHFVHQNDFGTKTQNKPQLPLILGNMVVPLIRNPTCMAVFVPSILNKKKLDPTVCAIGNQSGELQIIDILTGTINQSHKLLSYSIKTIRFYSAHVLLLICTYEEGKNNIHYCLMNFSIKTGCYKILTLPGVSPLTKITDISLSEKRTYMIVMLDYEESQLWRLENMSYLLNIQDSNKNVKTCCSWAYGYDQADKSTLDSRPVIVDDVIVVNTLNFAQQYHIRDNTLFKRDARSFNNLRKVTSIVRKLNYIIIGDIAGAISILNLVDPKENRIINTNAVDGIRRLRCSPAKNNLNFFHISGNTICFWDAHKGEPIKLPNREIFNSILEAEWLDTEHLIFLTTNGLVNVINLNTELTKNSLSVSAASNWFFMPHTLSLSDQLCMKQLMIWTPWRIRHSVEEINIFKEDEIENKLKSTLKLFFQRIPYFVRSTLMKKELPACARAFYSCLLFGDHNEAIFWSKVCYHLENKCDKEKFGSKIEILKECSQYSSSIELNIDISCPFEIYKKKKLWELLIKFNKNSDMFSKIIKKQLQMLILLGYGEEAISYFKMMKSDDDTYYTNVLRTIIIRNKEALSCDAMNMQSLLCSLLQKKFYCEVIELMFLTMKPSDALKTMVTFLPVEEHLEYAKTIITDEKEFNTFLQGFLSENLKSDTRISEIRKTFLLYLSIGDFENALTILNKIDCVSTAAIVYQSLLEFSLLDEKAARVRKNLEEKLRIYMARVNIYQTCSLGTIQ